MALGYLNKTDAETINPETGEVTSTVMLRGEIRTPSFRLKIILHPAAKPTPDHPDFTVEGMLNGNEFDAGVAWKYKIERGHAAGSDMFSVRFEDWPELRGLAGQQIAAFPDGPGKWAFQRERNRGPVYD